jgi:myosin heavy subunit
MQDFEAAAYELKKLRNFIKILDDTIKELPVEKQDGRFNKVLQQLSEINLESIEQTLLDIKEKVSAKNSVDSLERLKTQLQHKEEKINEFKLSLADSVMEFKELSRKYSQTNEKNKQLQKEVSHLQMIVKDTQLKLSTAQKNYSTNDELLKSTNLELYENKSKVYSMQSRIADIEDQLEEDRKKIAAANEQIEMQKNELEKRNRQNSDIKSSYDSLKAQHSALEERVEDFQSTIDVLQKEKERLQKKLDQFLTGIPKTFSYSHETPEPSTESALEPLKFPAYLPFCFPERLPRLSQFKKQIRKSFSKKFARINRKSPPVISQAFKLELPEEKLRMLSFRITLNCVMPENFSQALPKVERIQKNIGIPMKMHFQRPLEFSQPKAFKQINSEFKFPHLRFSSLQPPKRLKLPKHDEFLIETNSLDLLISYLSRNIIEANYLELKQHETFAREFAKQLYTPEITNKIIIFNEKLAFRYRYQLKSLRLILQRQNLKFSFRRGSGLKSVLKTFENTINSMVNKYDIFAKKPSGKS